MIKRYSPSVESVMTTELDGDWVECQDIPPVMAQARRKTWEEAAIFAASMPCFIPAVLRDALNTEGWAEGDRIRVETEGSTVRLYRNGVLIIDHQKEEEDVTIISTQPGRLMSPEEERQYYPEFTVSTEAAREAARQQIARESLGGTQ